MVAHVEFSLSEAQINAAPIFDGSLERWAFSVSSADEACLLLDSSGLVIAASPGCGALFSIRTADAVGRRLMDGVLRLLDFNTLSTELPLREVDRIPPLLAITSGGLARGLLRVAADPGVIVTVDAISTPLRDGNRTVGSLTFFAQVVR